MALIAAGESCPERGVNERVRRVVRRRGWRIASPAATAGAVARARAKRAVRRARSLYLRTNFAGCISLLSITEQELGRNLGASEATRLQRNHGLLAQVNLWLGICQWSAGDPQAAAASFRRSAQLPSSPIPDSRLLPPRVLSAYRRAVSSPRQEVSCRLQSPLTAHGLLVDGKGPTVQGATVRVAAGTHYVVLGACDASDMACNAIRRRLQGERSMRLNARPLGCVIQLPSAPAVAATPCVSEKEAADEGFVASVAREAGARDALVVSLARDRFALRMFDSRSRRFARQLQGTVAAGGDRPATLERSAALLLAVAQPPTPPTPPGGGKRPVTKAWYRRWWVWTIVGATLAATTTAAVVVGARSSSVRLVFGR